MSENFTVSGKKVLVIGARVSGVAAAKFLRARGAVVALNDQKPIEEWRADALALKAEGVGLLAGDVPMWLLDQINVVVPSPGVSPKSIPVRYAQRAGALVIGEIELASRYLRGSIVGITGSNGKTTTTTLTGELLRSGGLPTQVGGNIGTPLASLVDASRDDGWTVVELSSFQLETISDFHPRIAVVLNVTPDHMDRYESITDYAAAKHRIFVNQTKEDVAVLNADDEIVASWASGLRARVVRFSVQRELNEGVFLRRSSTTGQWEIVSRAARPNGASGANEANGGEEDEQVLITRDEMQLRGLHNVQNVMAALAVGLACGLSPDAMRASVREFRSVEHRLEHVAEINSIKFYNDSKATNVDATLKALEAFADNTDHHHHHRVILIIGGRGKGASYRPLAPLVNAIVRTLILIGEDAERIAEELGSAAPIERAGDMSDAVRRAFAAAEPGDTVLLAPACASFDMFKSYEHRGQAFKKAVGDLRF